MIKSFESNVCLSVLIEDWMPLSGLSAKLLNAHIHASMFVFVCVCVCVFSSPCSPLASHRKPRPGGSAVKQQGLSPGNRAGFSDAEIPLGGNILHYHWREDKRSKHWRRKTLSFQLFPRLLNSPVQQSICKALDAWGCSSCSRCGCYFCI